MDLADTSALLRLLSDPTRVRLLALLEREELTVAELAAVLHLAQPRVSTHLAKLREAGLVRDRRAGVSAYYRTQHGSDPHRDGLLHALREQIDDAVLDADAQRLPDVLAQRARDSGWADSVAGDMERHYSPGRTWETLARAMLQLQETGDVLDIASGDGVLGELLAPHARSILCVDASERVVAAARERLRPFANVEVRSGDMHALDLGARRFDLVLMLHALTYSEHPARAVAEAARVLRGGGRLLAVTLARHAHRAIVEPYDHRNLGFRREDLLGYAQQAGLAVIGCQRLGRERKPPHFEILSLLARKP
ncbi:MAG: ArsR family transcriptional regulator [Xanthomonadaceae bacterium]|nr:ArsR family transcriptional regulator [Xanthomonadaceae bacterium]MDE2177753.1 ArsR family transcriptional regulator [Xanthomonadaceae bacterium]MDE2245598.1 ArsR family transcriptional regulator [Xanthomonadaceae bacterium]